jgi:hypothetical protein
MRSNARKRGEDAAPPQDRGALPGIASDLLTPVAERAGPRVGVGVQVAHVLRRQALIEQIGSRRHAVEPFGHPDPAAGLGKRQAQPPPRGSRALVGHLQALENSSRIRKVQQRSSPVPGGCGAPGPPDRRWGGPVNDEKPNPGGAVTQPDRPESREGPLPRCRR